MNILVCASTTAELDGFLRHLEKIAESRSFLEFRINGHSIFPLITGVGAMKTAFALARFPRIKGVQLAINAGIAGAFDRELKPGSVLEVTKDRFADLGSENADGTLLDVFDLELESPDTFPFHNGWLVNSERPYHSDLPAATAITVNKVTGTPLSIALIREKYKADIETMEGAGFFYACKMMDIKCMQIRSVSNYVEPRKKENWQIELALEKLNQSVINLIHVLTKERYV